MPQLRLHEGPSLNDCLHTRPPLHKKIFEILVRFRVYPIALAADIEKAFLMIQISEPDQDVLRFLWFKDVHAEVPELNSDSEIYKGSIWCSS